MWPSYSFGGALAVRHPILKTVAIAAMTPVFLSGISAAAVPAVRHIASGWWNSPEGLAALAENPQVHYESDAIEQARSVAAALPDAIARIEAIQGRRFAHPVTIGVYSSQASFAAANGSGVSGAVGTMFLGRVMLSPALFARQRQRMPAILTHELSHAHLRSWLSELDYLRLPQWFREGLAVMVSGGGGAEAVSESQARDAIRRDDHIAIESSGSLFNLTAVKFGHAPEIPDSSLRTQMAYRQAALFVAFLHDSDSVAFQKLLDGIYQARPFAEAASTAYATDLPTLWSRFVQGGS
jgi:hypothetical protein